MSKAPEEDLMSVEEGAVDAEVLQSQPRTSTTPAPRPQVSSRIRDLENYEKKRGKVIFINHKEFEDISYPIRNAADDEGRLVRETFGNIEFDVEHYDDLSSTAVEARLKRTFKADYTKYGSLFVIISSYGEDSKLMGRDIPYQFEEKLHSLMNSQGKSLTGLPKVFIVQAYGPETPEGQPLRPGAADTTVVKPPIIPVFADLFIVYASKLGRPRPRIDNTPTSFIQLFCDTIRDQEVRTQHDLETIVGITTNRIGSTNDSIPILVTTLTKQFYFP